MAVTTTARLGLTRWSAGTDPFSRAQMDASMANLEANAAMYSQGTAAARPAFGKQGRFYFATDTKITSYDTGTAWEEVKNDQSSLATDAELAAGLATKAASSHSHAIGDLPVAASGSSSTTQLVRADDSRLSNARTPLAHTHPDLQAGIDSKAPLSHSHALGDLPVAASGVSSTTQLVRADDSRLSNARTPVAHTHAIGDLPVAASGEVSSTELVRANDSRLSNARTPTAHTHGIGDLPVAGSGVVSSTQLVRADDERLGTIKPGMMVVWPVPRTRPVPTGWARCDGQTKVRSTEADLFAEIGTTWGAGDGSTTYNLPNMTQRMPYGSTGGSGAAPLGSYGGSASRTILEANLPAHDHSMAHSHTFNHSHTASASDTNTDHLHYYDTGYSGGHSHSYVSNVNRNNYTSGGSFGAAYAEQGATTGGDGGHGHSGYTGGADRASGQVHSHSITVNAYNGSTGGSSAANTGNTGGGTALDVLNPYAAVDWIIKL